MERIHNIQRHRPRGTLPFHSAQMIVNRGYSDSTLMYGSVCVAFGAMGALAVFARGLSTTSSSYVELLVLPTPLLFIILVSMNILWQCGSSKRTPPFRFLELPAELREQVYLYSVDRDPLYPAKPDGCKHPTSFQRLIQGKPKVTGAQALLLTSRQLHDEYVSVLAKAATFTLIVNEKNYAKSTMWSISPTTLSTLRQLRLELRLKPSMMGTFDPRHASQSPSTEWPLYSRLLSTMSMMEKLKTVDLYVHACGNPIWNPLWLWHYASQTFKGAELHYTQSSQSFNISEDQEQVSQAPQLRSIHFKMDDPGLGENYIGRNKDRSWEWKCRRGHTIQPENKEWVPIRAFCSALPAECEVCKAMRKEMERLAAIAD